MKVYISVDIEGCAGITHWDEAEKNHADWQEFREQMTREAVAAIEGAQIAGATEILVKDAHSSGRNIIDGPGLKNVDMTISRTFRLREKTTLQFRGEATNALNIVNLSNPGTNANTAATFGKVTTARPMRQAQLGLKLVF